ncbi:MAG: Asp/Glu/hydantoin racemase [Ruminiclostridium sp.]|nr:Asp/Glu/hydantoin racemase [Ruminiclostridium sp.]
MGKKVAVIHTSFVSVGDLKDLFKEIMPSVKLINIVDDSLLAEVLEKGGLTNNVTRRICTYAMEAAAMGADMILNQCSSVGEAVDVARKMINIPYLKVDEPMAEEAAKIGGNISVIATVPTTMGPSVRLIERTARDMNKEINIKRCLVEGAFDALVKGGDKEKHNRMVLEKVREEAKEADVIVLAQGSMICLLPQLGGIRVPVLTSPRSGVMRVRQLLDNLCPGSLNHETVKEDELV